jgi:hypothetical protein
MAELVTDWIQYTLIGCQLHLLELALTVLVVLLALRAPRSGTGLFQRVEASLDRLSRRPRLCVAVIGLAPVLIRVALLPVLSPPAPDVHDEFSYLLAADTFAHGRLTNPPHPMWEAFESFHIIQRPSYASKYPPAQALFLAAGEVLTGYPWAGVVLSVGLMCATVVWMLQGWLPARWALVGGLIAAIRFGVFSYWMNSYWGGAAAALGGALVMGVLPRLRREIRVRHSAVLACGIALLANSRPYEGLLLATPALVTAAVWVLRGTIRPRTAAIRLVIPASLLLSAVAAWNLYYNWRVTGDPFTLPYQVHQKQYALISHFIWQPYRTTPPEYGNSEMRRYFTEFELQAFPPFHPVKYVRKIFGKMREFWLFFVSPALTVPLLLVLRRPGARELRPLVAVFLVSWAGYAITVYWLAAHYAAPLTAVTLALLVEGLRRLRRWRFAGRPAGVFLSRAFLLLCLGLPFVAKPLGLSAIPGPASLCPTETGNVERAEIVRKLSSAPGVHLVIVRYSSAHDFHHEWVYNEADIDRAKVVWARDRGPQENRRLLDYFKGRTFWLLEADSRPARLTRTSPRVSTPAAVE